MGKTQTTTNINTDASCLLSFRLLPDDKTITMPFHSTSPSLDNASPHLEPRAHHEHAAQTLSQWQCRRD